MKHQLVIDLCSDKNASEFENTRREHEDVFKKLERVGVTFSFSFKRYFSINFDEDVYNTVVLRGAGRKKVAAVSEKGNPVTCAEVLLMMKNMTDYEIMEKINMRKATYYRHKKAMLESDWYRDHARNLDLNDPNLTAYITKISPVF